MSMNQRTHTHTHLFDSDRALWERCPLSRDAALRVSTILLSVFSQQQVERRHGNAVVDHKLEGGRNKRLKVVTEVNLQHWDSMRENRWSLFGLIIKSPQNVLLVPLTLTKQNEILFVLLNSNTRKQANKLNRLKHARYVTSWGFEWHDKNVQRPLMLICAHLLKQCLSTNLRYLYSPWEAALRVYSILRGDICTFDFTTFFWQL